MDTSIKDFCTSKESCRRKSLLKAVGSTESVISSDNPCCDVCNPDVPDHIVRLQAAALSIRKQRRRCVRNVSSDQEVQVTEALMRERDVYIDSHPGYKMLGPEFVLSTALFLNKFLLYSQ